MRTSPRSKYDHFSKSHMFYDLGFDNTRDGDVDYVRESIDSIDAMFDLVLVSDYFDESMVLLSELLCWPIEDFACLTLNGRIHKEPGSEEVEERIRKKVSLERA